MEILKSASKLVFTMLALTACFAFIAGTLWENNFMIPIGWTFAFYFSNKAEALQPYAGK